MACGLSDRDRPLSYLGMFFVLQNDCLGDCIEWYLTAGGYTCACACARARRGGGRARSCFKSWWG